MWPFKPKPDPKIGEVWMLDRDRGPFDEPTKIRILDIKMGWVQYQFDRCSSSSTKFSSRLKSIKEIYCKVEEKP